MRTIDLGDRRRYSGETARGIVEDIQSRGVFVAELPLEDYIADTKAMALKHHGVELDISGETVEDRCENLLQSILDAGLGRIVSQGRCGGERQARVKLLGAEE